MKQFIIKTKIESVTDVIGPFLKNSPPPVPFETATTWVVAHDGDIVEVEKIIQNNAPNANYFLLEVNDFAYKGVGDFVSPIIDVLKA